MKCPLCNMTIRRGKEGTYARAARHIMISHRGFYCWCGFCVEWPDSQTAVRLLAEHLKEHHITDRHSLERHERECEVTRALKEGVS